MRKLYIAGATLAVVAIFGGGYAAGQGAATRPANRFGQPHTVLQVSIIKYRPGTTDAQKQEIVEGLKQMAGQIPGIKNIWTKAARIEPRDFDAEFVIEFVNRDAADNYAESPIHEAWSRKLQEIRYTSLSPQITN